MNNLKIWAVSILTAFLFGALASYFAAEGHFQAELATLTPEVEIYMYIHLNPPASLLFPLQQAMMFEWGIWYLSEAD